MKTMQRAFHENKFARFQGLSLYQLESQQEINGMIIQEGFTKGLMTKVLVGCKMTI